MIEALYEVPPLFDILMSFQLLITVVFMYVGLFWTYGQHNFYGCICGTENEILETHLTNLLLSGNEKFPRVLQNTDGTEDQMFMAFVLIFFDGLYKLILEF